MAFYSHSDVEKIHMQITLTIVELKLFVKCENAHTTHAPTLKIQMKWTLQTKQNENETKFCSTNNE